jgi:hypothetical protein
MAAQDAPQNEDHGVKEPVPAERLLGVGRARRLEAADPGQDGGDGEAIDADAERREQPKPEARARRAAGDLDGLGIHHGFLTRATAAAGSPALLADQASHLIGHGDRGRSRAGSARDPDSPAHFFPAVDRQAAKSFPKETLCAIAADGGTDLPAGDVRDTAVVVGRAEGDQGHQSAVVGAA